MHKKHPLLKTQQMPHSVRHDDGNEKPSLIIQQIPCLALLGCGMTTPLGKGGKIKEKMAEPFSLLFSLYPPPPAASFRAIARNLFNYTFAKYICPFSLMSIFCYLHEENSTFCNASFKPL